MSFNLPPNYITPPNRFSSHETESSEFPHLSERQCPLSAADINIPLDSTYSTSEMDEDTDSPSISDEEMNKGPPLTMTLSHAQYLNAELDALDAEIMGDENMKRLHADSYYPEDHDGIGYRYYDDDVYDSETYPDLDESVLDIQAPNHYNYLENWPYTAYQQNQQLNFNAGVNERAPPTYHAHHNELIEMAGISEATVPTNIPSSPLSNASETAASSVPLSYPSRVSSLAAPPPNNELTTELDSNVQFTLWPAEGLTSLSNLAAIGSHQATLLGPSSPAQVELMVFSANDGNFASDALFNAENFGAEDQSNFDLYGTLRYWSDEVSHSEPRQSRGIRGPSMLAVEALRSEKPDIVHRSDLRGDECDIQKINWRKLGITRVEARQRRGRLYRNYTSIRYPELLRSHFTGCRLKNSENYFQFRRMDFKHEIHMLHFQLRNLIASPTRDNIFYGGRSKILHRSPSHGEKKDGPSTALDLSSPKMSSVHSMTRGVQITTMAVGHNVLVAGGFCGEYGLINLLAEKGTKHTEGLISAEQNSIVNHIQVHCMRGNASPVAAFASNNSNLQILDISTNTIVAEHSFEYAINCSAISPDQRLRVMVGDTRQVLICNAETGAKLQALEGHYDFGFACDWADDGWTVATGNQDQQIKIWDARKWTTSQGIACPIATVLTEMAGVRKLKFSPLGSGKRVLVAAEPIDYVSIIDAERFNCKQTLSFFGEISGFDFTNDGQDIFVANSDKSRGGIMEFERSNLAGYGRYDLESVARTRNLAGICDWMSERDVVSHERSHATFESLERRAASLGISMGYF